MSRRLNNQRNEFVAQRYQNWSFHRALALRERTGTAGFCGVTLALKEFLGKLKLLFMSLETEVTYHYLEPRPHPWRKILWIVGRNMHVWHLVATMLREGETPEETAKNFGLPVEAVREALDYYQRNKALVDAETEEEGRRLHAKGQL